jgi:putative ABC transport system ATP-binding protein
VTKSYGHLVRAVDGVSLRVEAGQVALLTGPSGSGKSTLLNLIAGFDVPDSGTITVDGRSVTDTTDTARFRREVLGFVFQSHHLVSGLTALDNVEVALLPTGRRRSERLEMARASLAEVGMAARTTHLPSQLSGGERQRVAVARALANRPRLLLADEPTGQLDTASGIEILELFRALRDRHGMSILLVSHDQEARRYADVTFQMRDGRLVTPAPPPDAVA